MQAGARKHVVPQGRRGGRHACGREFGDGTVPEVEQRRRIHGWHLQGFRGGGSGMEQGWLSVDR